MKANIYNLLSREQSGGEDILPVSLEEAKTQIKWDTSDTSIDDELTMMIKAAQDVFEDLTGRTLVMAKFETFRDCWESATALERAPFRPAETVTVTYTTDSGDEVLPSDEYGFARRTPYAYLMLLSGFDPVADLSEGYDKIKIEFYAGIAKTQAEVPSDIKRGILEHIAAMWVNRGDCPDSGSGDCGSCPLPANARRIYMNHAIRIVGNCVLF